MYVLRALRYERNQGIGNVTVRLLRWLPGIARAHRPHPHPVHSPSIEFFSLKGPSGLSYLIRKLKLPVHTDVGKSSKLFQVACKAPLRENLQT